MAPLEPVTLWEELGVKVCPRKRKRSPGSLLSGSGPPRVSSCMLPCVPTIMFRLSTGPQTAEPTDNSPKPPSSNRPFCLCGSPVSCCSNGLLLCYVFCCYGKTAQPKPTGVGGRLCFILHFRVTVYHWRKSGPEVRTVGECSLFGCFQAHILLLFLYNPGPPAQGFCLPQLASHSSIN